MEKRILIAYVQGQDIDCLQQLLCQVAEKEGVPISFYVPPMTQGAGLSATCWVRLGVAGCAEWLSEQGDVLLALEELEGRRSLYAVRHDAPIILCNAHRLPMAVAAGTVGYPTDTCDRMVVEKRTVWKVEQKEIQPCMLMGLLLRGIGYDREQALQWLLGLDNAEEIVQNAYAKTALQ